eukprot:3222054-Rhodomonas_salina.1
MSLHVKASRLYLTLKKVTHSSATALPFVATPLTTEIVPMSSCIHWSPVVTAGNVEGQCPSARAGARIPFVARAHEGADRVSAGGRSVAVVRAAGALVDVGAGDPVPGVPR